MTSSPCVAYPAINVSRVSSRQTRNFGFGLRSQSHLRLRHRPQKPAGLLHASSSQGARARDNLRAHCPCFARKTGAHRPWCARSPGRGFTGSPPFIRLAPVPGPDARNPFRARSGPTSPRSALGSAKGAQQKPTPIPLLLAPAQTGIGVALDLLLNPLTQAEARGEGEGQARRGGARVKRIKTKVPWVSRTKTTVRWTVVPANAQAKDGLGRCPSVAGNAQPQGLSR